MSVLFAALGVLFGLSSAWSIFEGEPFEASSVMAMLCLILSKLYDEGGGGS